MITRIRFAALTVLLAAALPGFSDSPPTNTGTTRQPANPNPKNCCNSITIAIGDQSQPNSPGKKGPSIPAETNGDYKVKLKVKVTDSPNVKITKIELVPVGGVGNASRVDVIPIPDPQLYEGTVTIPGSQVKSSDTINWKVVVTCSGEATGTSTSSSPATIPCESPFTLGGGCKSCASGTCPGDADNGCFSYDIPVGDSNGGDSTGTIRFFTPDFNNPGRSGVSAFVPSNFTVNRTAGIITSVVTPTNTIELSSAATTFDPNAFTITHKHTASGTVFRTTTIGRIQDGAVTYFRADSTFNGNTFRFQQSQPAAGTFILESGPVVGTAFTPLRKETLTITVPLIGTEVHRETTQELDPVTSTFVTVSDIATTWNKFAWGWEMTQQATEPDGANLVSTWSYYQPGELTGPNGSTEGLGRVHTYSRYDGYQEVHTYWLNNHQTQMPFAGNTQGLTVSNQYNPSTRTLTTTETVAGNTLSKKTRTYDPATNTSIDTVYSSSSASLSTITKMMPYTADFGGQPASVTHPDLTLTTYSYQRHSDGGKTIIMQNGVASGNTVSLGKSTTTTYNRYGTAIRSVTDTIGYPTNITLDHSAVTSVDDFGRPLITAAFPSASSAADGAVQASATAPQWTTAVTYSCCGTASSTDREGNTTTYAYDGLRRQTKSTSLGVTQETVHRGLTTDNHRYPAGGSASTANLISRRSSNLTSTQSSTWSPDPSSTTPEALVEISTATTYQPAAGLSTRSITTTPSGTQTTDTFLDGKTSKSTGSLQPPMVYGYEVASIGFVSTGSYLDGSTAKETSSSQSDWAGRTLSTTKGSASTSLTYNSLGQAVSTTDADGVRTLSAYNTLGEHTTSAIDINGNGQIDFDGTDRITLSTNVPGTYSGIPVMSQTTQVYATNGSDTAATVATSYSTPDGLRSWSLSPGVENPSSRVINPSNWEVTTTNPDGTKTISIYTGGRLTSTEHHSSLASSSLLSSVSYGYDSLGRPVSSTDSRTGTTTTAYVSTTYDAVLSTTDPGNRVTTFGYDSQGRRLTTTLPDNTVTHTSYYPDGQVKATWGSQTYPTFTTYDYAGRQKTLRTQPTLVSDIPTNEGGSVTTWNYSSTTGQLLSKLDDAGKGAIYSYTPAGRLSTRTWARTVSGAPLTTAYGYSDGLLTTTDYSDATPDVTITHNRLGQPLTITQVNQSRITNTYDPATLAINKETISYDLDHDGTDDFSRVLDRSQDSLGRSTGFQLKDGSTLENRADYAYSATDGRTQSISGGGSQAPSPANTFTYNYLANSNLIEKISGPIHDVNNAWEQNRNVLAYKQNKVGTTVVSRYDYTVNALGQRTNLATSGSAFPNVPSWLWGYDSLGQVISADSNVNTSDRAYQYDTIGNRQRAAAGNLDVNDPVATLYTANGLNQYSQITSNSVTSNPAFDADGNMTSGPLPVAPSTNSALVWDAENRLISTTVNGVTTTYLYDAQARRICTQSPISNPQSTLYIYDGFNCIAEYSGTTLSKTRLWGIDLSGSMQGAGGVGGLLSEKQGSNIFYPLFDGNGNVSEYLAADGSIAAHFEFDPFGNTVVNTDSGNLFNYRFSTKPLDFSTGFYYYQYRWYDPLTGRWPSRDPIEEAGGVNLYGFVRNNGIDKFDLLGNVAFLNIIPAIWEFEEVEGKRMLKKDSDSQYYFDQAIKYITDHLKDMEKELSKLDSISEEEWAEFEVKVDKTTRSMSKLEFRRLTRREAHTNAYLWVTGIKEVDSLIKRIVKQREALRQEYDQVVVAGHSGGPLLHLSDGYKVPTERFRIKNTTLISCYQGTQKAKITQAPKWKGGELSICTDGTKKAELKPFRIITAKVHESN